MIWKLAILFYILAAIALISEKLVSTVWWNGLPSKERIEWTIKNDLPNWLNAWIIVFILLFIFGIAFTLLNIVWWVLVR